MRKKLKRAEETYWAIQQKQQAMERDEESKRERRKSKTAIEDVRARMMSNYLQLHNQVHRKSETFSKFSRPD